ncbi:MAG: hypothetical protein FJY85_17175 [Deltaproteobacteria bacterium]|nr:hypothetical protein [Deltaproteobacteria bacterium]
MGKVVRSVAFAGACLFLSLSTVGCTIATGVWPVPQSHFAYPNSNVIPLGEGKGEASDTSFGLPSIGMDPDLMQQAVQAAIQTKGGNLLVDYDLYFEISTIPGLPIYTTTWRVEGTVAKMEIGKQILK